MSCGSPHQTPCREVLSSIFLYLDHELDQDPQIKAIEIHLEECPPCGQRYALEERLHNLLASCCSAVEAPHPLRQRVLQRLTELRIEMTLESPDTE